MSSTVYPEGIDHRRFFSDISLQNKDVLTQHSRLMREKKYQEASAMCVDNQSSYNADLFNTFEYRVEQIGLVAQGITDEVERAFYSDIMPSSSITYKNMIWIN